MFKKLNILDEKEKILRIKCTEVTDELNTKEKKVLNS